MNRTIQSLLAIVLIMLAGYASWLLILALEPELPSAPPRDVGAPRITQETVVSRDLSVEVLAYGNLEATRVVQLAAEVSGRIVALHGGWRPGAEVQAGELLVGLDASLFELDVQSARAVLAEAEAAVGVVSVEQARARADERKLGETLQVARRQFERLVELGHVASDLQRDAALLDKLNAERALEIAQGSAAASQAALVRSEAGVQSAKAALQRAEALLERTSIRAPFAGRLRGHPPALGTLATLGMVLAELLDPESMILGVHVPERDLLLLKRGMRARLWFPNTPETDAGASIEGVLSAVDIASDPLTRRGLVEIELDGGQSVEGMQLLPAGLFARAMIEVERMQDVIWIDRRHFRWEGPEAVAYVLGSAVEGPEVPLAKRRVLTLWREHGEGFIVKAGLQAGDRLITAPLDRMQPEVHVMLGGTAPKRVAPSAEEAP